MGTTPGFGQAVDGYVKYSILLDDLLSQITFEDLSADIYETFNYTNQKGLLWITHSTQGTVYKNPGFDTSDFSNPDTTLVSLTKVISFDGHENGTYTVRYKITNGTSVNTITKSYDLNVTLPGATVSRSINYDISVLLVNDSSSYLLTSGSQSVVPFSVQRYMKIRPPIGSGLDPYEEDNAPQSVTYGPSIYTGNYDIHVATTLIYNLEKWGDEDWFSLKSVVNHYDSFNIEQTDDCILGCISCIRQLSEKLASARNRSQRDAEYYERLVHDIGFYYGVYLMYKSANMDTSYACEKIKNILRKECTIDMPVSNIPVEIVPIYDIQGAGVGVDGSKWYSGTATPDTQLGVEGDFYLNTTNGKVYKKTTIWVYQMTLLVRGNRIIKTIYQSQTLTALEDIVFVNSTTPPGVAVTLPVGVSEGHALTLVFENLTYPIAVLPGVGTIEGSAVYLAGTQGDSIDLVRKGTNWKIV